MTSVCVLGPRRVGKSSIAQRYTSDVFPSDYDETIAELYQKSNGVQVRDTGGGFEMVDTYYRQQCLDDADAALLVYDANDRKSLDELPKFAAEVMKLTCPPAVVVVANKSDTVDDSAPVVTAGEIFARRNSWPHIVCSAMNNYNIEAVFSLALKAIRAEKDEQEEKDTMSCCVIG